MADQDRLGDRVLDLVVYAPIGLALEAKELLPKLADRGRGQVALVRLAGRVAGQQRNAGVGRLVEDLRHVVRSALAVDTDARDLEDEPGDPDPMGNDIELPIEGYQTMSAPELLGLLDDLADDDLATLLDFEQQHRARATVINRIRQLRT